MTNNEKESALPKDILAQKVISWYPQEVKDAVTDLLTKNNLTQYSNSFDKDGNLIDENKIPPTDKVKLTKIKDAVINHFTNQAQDTLSKDTNEVIKTKAVEALVKNIGQYFEIKNYKQEDFAKDFSVDTKNDIKFDGKMLTLSGTMQGKEIGFYLTLHNFYI